jgi:hypothetical protein
MLAVSNTSPLIALAKIDQFIIFRQLFQTVLIPQAVSEEFMKNCTLLEKTNFQHACQDCIETVQVQSFSQTFSRRLGVGERETITLAIQKQADILIIDDRKAFNEAREHKLTAISTRAVLRMAAEQKVITDYQTLELALKQENFFLPNY